MYSKVVHRGSLQLSDQLGEISIGLDAERYAVNDVCLIAVGDPQSSVRGVFACDIYITRPTFTHHRAARSEPTLSTSPPHAPSIVKYAYGRVPPFVSKP